MAARKRAQGIRLTERDVRILSKCACAKWLTTSQIGRLFFSGATQDAVRRRLRKLVGARYLSSRQRHRMEEAFFGVGPNGKAVLEERGVRVEIQKNLPQQREHFRVINGLRVEVECGPFLVGYFFAFWELQGAGWHHAILPDAVFCIQQSEEGERQTILVEYDRGTQTLDRACKKMALYDKGLDGFLFDAVLVLTDSTRRLGNMKRRFLKLGVRPGTFVGCTVGEIWEAGLFAPVFCDLAVDDRGKRKLFDWGSEALFSGALCEKRGFGKVSCLF